MNTRRWLNVALLVLVTALGAAAWYDANRPPKDLPPHLTALRPEAVAAIELIRPDDKVVLAREGGGWVVRQPIAIAADSFQVDNVLRVLGADSLARFPVAGRDLAAYGLAAPEVRVRFADTELDFGALTPLDQRRYVRIGDTVHLITDSYYLDLTAPAATFASRKLVPAGSVLAALTLPELVLRKEAAGKWQATPAARFASTDDMQKLADAWRDAEALRAAPYRPAPALGEAVVGFAGGGTLRYVITARGDEWVLARPEAGLQFHLAGEQAARLFALAPPTAAKDKAAAAHE